MLILASSSFSRKKILEKSGIEFKSISSNFNENSIKIKDTKKLCERLSLEKAKAVYETLKAMKENEKSELSKLSILGCDSIFEFKGEALGKPLTKEEAIERWKKMNSNSGILHTGHSLLTVEKNINNFQISNISSEVISTKVFFSRMNSIEIKNYVETKEPLYSAGGFQIEGKGGMYIDRIEGCYSNVMGLSLPWLKENLQ